MTAPVCVLLNLILLDEDWATFAFNGDSHAALMSARFRIPQHDWVQKGRPTTLTVEVQFG